MDPLTLMLLGGGFELVTGLIGTGLSMDAARREADVNAKELERSANLELAKGVDALKQGQVQAGNARMKTGQLRGEQAVGYAKGNIDSSTGTAADVGAYTERIGELDATTLENNAVRAAFGFRESARSLRIKRDNVLEQGAAAQTRGLLSAFGQVGSAVGRGASVYSQAKSKGG